MKMSNELGYVNWFHIFFRLSLRLLLISYQTIINQTYIDIITKVSAVSIDNLVVEALLERGLKPENVDILIEIDDGQGILKVIL